MWHLCERKLGVWGPRLKVELFHVDESAAWVNLPDARREAQVVGILDPLDNRVAISLQSTLRLTSLRVRRLRDLRSFNEILAMLCREDLSVNILDFALNFVQCRLVSIDF